MAFLDPSEKPQIDELLAANQPVAAGESLLESGNLRHRALRPLVTKCVDDLAQAARHAFDQGDLGTAVLHIQLAKELRSLSGEHAGLCAEIESEVAKRKKADLSDQERIVEAQELLQQKRLQTSIERLVPLGDDSEASRIRQRAESLMSTYHRYCNECEECLNEEDWNAAKTRLENAGRTYPKGARLDSLRKRIGENIPEMQELKRSVKRNDRGMVLDFSSPKVNTMVFFGNTQVIGATTNDGTLPDIPINARLHAQHAVIYRHFMRIGGIQEKQMRYWVTPHPSYAKSETTPDSYNYVAVRKAKNKIIRELETGTLQGLELLESGDEILLGDGPDRVSVTLLFKQRPAKSLTASDAVVAHTATLEFARQGENSRGARFPIFAANKVPCGRVALMYESLIFGKDSKLSDLPTESMPVDQFSYHWKAGELQFECKELFHQQWISSSGKRYSQKQVVFGATINLEAEEILAPPKSERPRHNHLRHLES